MQRPQGSLARTCFSSSFSAFMIPYACACVCCCVHAITLKDDVDGDYKIKFLLPNASSVGGQIAHRVG